jgi:hypothetical protein
MIKFDYQNTSWRIDMDKNVGGADKSIRVVLGVVLILAGIFPDSCRYLSPNKYRIENCPVHCFRRCSRDRFYRPLTAMEGARDQHPQEISVNTVRRKGRIFSKRA